MKNTKGERKMWSERKVVKLKTVLVYILGMTSVALCMTNIMCVSVRLYQIWRTTRFLGQMAMFLFCNLMIMIDVTYIMFHVSMNSRYHWSVSCHFFICIVSLLTASVVILTTFHYLPYNVVIAPANVFLFISIFGFNYLVVEALDLTQDDSDMGKKSSTSTSRIARLDLPCKRISLYGQSVNKNASTSQKQARHK